MHGKTSMIHHTGKSVFAGLPEPFEATRYHSLLVKKSTLPDCLEVTAVAGDDETEIMGLRHKELPIHGVQFHPESILTLEGKKLLKNFLEMAREPLLVCCERIRCGGVRILSTMSPLKAFQEALRRLHH